MTFTPQQLSAYREYFSILEGIARRLHREGKLRIENGKIIFTEDAKTPPRKRRKLKVINHKE